MALFTSFHVPDSPHLARVVGKQKPAYTGNSRPGFAQTPAIYGVLSLTWRLQCIWSHPRCS
uniref:Uncharacterized protein n=1 Tax=Anguilla anguilla TaxID=7936 RepID=A0A0E9RY65_ANGAN